jgi:hypothetical protein
MARIAVSLSRTGSLPHVPLAVLGYALRRAGVLDPLLGVELPGKALAHTPGEKLLEALVLILAGGRATYQADRLLRPNPSLARAWGQAQFAEQSTLARTLDGLTADSVHQVRGAFEAITAVRSQMGQHDFRTGSLWLDGDLTGLPASKRAVGSQKGYFWGKKTAPGGRWRVSPVASTGKRSARGCTSARPKVCMPLSRWCARPKACCH